MISSYNSLGEERYYDVEGRSSFAFDHMTQVRKHACPVIRTGGGGRDTDERIESVRCTNTRPRIRTYRSHVRPSTLQKKSPPWLPHLLTTPSPEHLSLKPSPPTPTSTIHPPPTPSSPPPLPPSPSSSSQTSIPRLISGTAASAQPTSTTQPLRP